MDMSQNSNLTHEDLCELQKFGRIKWKFSNKDRLYSFYFPPLQNPLVIQNLRKLHQSHISLQNNAETRNNTTTPTASKSSTEHNPQGKCTFSTN